MEKGESGEPGEPKAWELNAPTSRPNSGAERAPRTQDPLNDDLLARVFVCRTHGIEDGVRVLDSEIKGAHADNLHDRVLVECLPQVFLAEPRGRILAVREGHVDEPETFETLPPRG